MRARPDDIIALLRQSGENDGDMLMLEKLQAAVRRRRKHCPALERLFGEIDSLPTTQDVFDRIRFSAGRTEDLLEVLPGRGTGSCTDGPRGSKRELGVVHGLHRAAFKVLVSRPHPRRGWAEPQPFGSMPGFVVRGSHGACLFVHSMEVGGEVYKIRDGFAVLAKGLAKLLDEATTELGGLDICLFTGFRNIGGQALLEAYRRVVPCEEKRLDLELDSADLRAIGVRRFYGETLDRVSPPGTRATGRIHRMTDVPVVCQLAGALGSGSTAPVSEG